MHKLFGLLILFLTFNVQGSEDDLTGTAWIVESYDPVIYETARTVYLLAELGELVYMSLNTGNAGVVYRGQDGKNKWEWTNPKLVFFVNDDYMRVAFDLDKNGKIISGTGININGVIVKYTGRKIEW